MEFRKETLANGLQVIAECNPEAPSTAVAFFVNTGARDETPEVAGVSHFLEHMVFKGTPTRSADEVNARFDELGADYNAWTSKENTIYHAAVLPEYQTDVIELWADIMRPSLREEDFDTEKQVIIEEIRMYEDQPPFGADDRCEVAHFGDHPLANRVLGTVESVSDLKVDAMRDYFRARYSPTNIVLGAAGRVDFEQLVETAQRCCGDWQQHDVDRDAQAPKPRESFETMHRASATQEYVIQLSAAPSATDPQRFAAHLLINMLGDSSGSRLYWELIHPGLAEHASTHFYEYEGAGLYMTWLCCEPEAVADNLQRTLDVYRKAEGEGFEQEELDRSKSKFNSRLVLGSERSQNRLFSVGMNWLRRHEYRRVKDDMDAYAAVTLDDVAAVQQKYPLSHNATICVGPEASVTAPE